MKLCSACLLGVKCRYDGKDKGHKGLIELSKSEVLVPVCPEQLGGLTAPREPSEQRGDRVFSRNGRDVTENFKKGADAVLKMAKALGAKEAIFKENSPSCGSKQVYDGTFSGKTIEGAGVTTKLLRENGIKVISEEKGGRV